jgi:hypothetical protein
LLNPLRPKPFRGDVIAAGVVVLATLVWVVRARFGGVWGSGGLLAFAAVPWAFVTLLAVLAPMEREEPRAYQSVLYVTSLALAIAVLLSLSQVLGMERWSAPATTAIFAALAALSFFFAVARNSAVCTFVGALSGGVAAVALFIWIVSPDDDRAFRWLLLALMLAYMLGAVAQRDRHLRHGVALIDAAGVAVVALATSFVPIFTFVFDSQYTHNVDSYSGVESLFACFSLTGACGSEVSVGWGWELAILAAGFGLVAYSSIDRQPGPAYFGVATLGLSAVVISAEHGPATLVGWPLILAVAAVILLAIGLRPSTPAPPPPDIDAPEPPPLPLR